ncbi:MAG: glycine dehydrogenase, partial [Pseudonocardia sp.]|nr:glycine dehydrogenase [Pseudonocardia sp.]
EPLGIELVVGDGLPEGEFFGVLLSYPGASGLVRDPSDLIAEAHERGALVAVAADLLALTLLAPPGELGADAVVGTTQRFGVPMAFGGPHAAFLSVDQKHARQLPGRLVGMSRDADGHPALRLALQTREQHIRREKATSNICTAQVLLAVVAACYAVHHGPDGLRTIARRTHRMAAVLAAGLRAGGADVVHDAFFDTVQVRADADAVLAAAHDSGIALRRVDGATVGVACSELTTRAHLETVWAAFGVTGSVDDLDAATDDALPAELARTSEYLTHPVFHSHRSETALMRWLRRLADADLALDRTMIPLGSCTMKLNATVEMEPITWPGFADLHPFAPAADTAGTLELIADLERWLAELTGYAAVTVAPNAGSQGEFAGLLAIAAYHRSRGDDHRDVCLIPASAHGTNAASAVMAGMRVVVVATAPTGDVDLDDLRAKISSHREHLAALMITYPSTHGVYEAQVREVCDAVHEAGGQVYVDGANLNALVGVARPGAFGGDVSHLNLHKTFCIPHGGGGPGVGPVAVAEHLAPFLPGRAGKGGHSVGPVSAAPHGSPGVLPISWAYVRLMGLDGLRRATLTAVAAANYVAARLGEHYPVLYAGTDGQVAHECIL